MVGGRSSTCVVRPLAVCGRAAESKRRRPTGNQRDADNTSPRRPNAICRRRRRRLIMHPGLLPRRTDELAAPPSPRLASPGRRITGFLSTSWSFNAAAAAAAGGIITL